jgi:hypothetical protein
LAVPGRGRRKLIRDVTPTRDGLTNSGDCSIETAYYRRQRSGAAHWTIGVLGSAGRGWAMAAVVRRLVGSSGGQPAL